jgi:transcriptional regulator with XRE-family HTH domain
LRFGELIADKRKRLGISQKELAQRIKKEDGQPISAQYLNDIEHERRNPPPAPLLDQFAKLLDLDPDLLYVYALADQLPAEIKVDEHEPEKLTKAMKAFRQTLRPR